MLEAYCTEVGIPYSDDLLTWQPGDEVMTNRWMVPKQVILNFRTIGMHDSSFSSTGFHKSFTAAKKAPSGSAQEGDQLLQMLPPELAVKFGEHLAQELPFYEDMFAERLMRVNANNNI